MGKGFIDVNNLSAYTIDGKKDEYGVIQKETSLKHLMSNCTDFEEEESLLQSMGRQMGVMIDRTPKCHCEMAGERVEPGDVQKMHTELYLLVKRGGGKPIEILLDLVYHEM